MELRHLRYFVAVAEEQHIGRAAERLLISQPPLTRQIHQLEHELDTVLFTRTARGMVLTEAGHVFLADARNLLELADRASERVQRAGGGALGRLDIAVFGTGVFRAIPLLLREHQRQFPDVRLVLHNMAKDEQLAALAERRINLAFNRLMPPVDGIVTEVLLTEPLFAAIPAEHPLAARTAVTIAELEGQPLIMSPTGMRPSFIDVVIDLCANAGFTPTVVAEVADVIHAITLVATGLGVCLVARSATNLHVPGVVYRPIGEKPRPTVDLCCLYREDDTSPVLAALLESMRAAAPAIARAR
ncbi:MAG: LysR family transcriptional regulator [Nocardioidaceae bacterium]